MAYVILLIFIPVFWVMIIRPQQQQRRAHMATVASLEIGQQVMTVGGLIGTVTRVDAETVTLDAGAGTELTFGRTFIRQTVEVPISDAGAAPDGADDMAENQQGDQVHDRDSADGPETATDLDEGAA